MLRTVDQPMRLAPLTTPFRISLLLLSLPGGIAAQGLGSYPQAVPQGLPGPVPAPEHNPLTAQGFELGERLFFDPILSVDRSVSCASCHRPELGFASAEALPPGAGDRRARRHAPALINRAWGGTQSWDGAHANLEVQVLAPIENPDEMDLPVADAIERIRAESSYREQFERVYGAPPDRENLGRALASFVRGLVLADSPVDHFIGGRRAALTPQELAGQWVYESKGRCWRCHERPNYSDELFHNTGVGAVDGEPASGREAVTGKPEDAGAFKTPTLRGVALSPPYMHDGSLASLEEVVEFYAGGGNENRNLSPLIQPLDLSAEDKTNLVAFLRALSRTSAPSADAHAPGRPDEPLPAGRKTPQDPKEDRR